MSKHGIHAAFAGGLLVAAVLATAQEKPAAPGTLPSVTARVVFDAVHDRLRSSGVADADEPDYDDFDFSLVPGNISGRVEIDRVGWNYAAERLQFRVRCSRRECLPFLVHAKVDRKHALHIRELVNSSGSIAPRQRPMLPAKLFAGPTLVNAGSAAKLLLEGERLRITVPVICLERGRRGQTIRAKAVEGHRLFHVRVVDRGLVVGSL